jgi:transcriptional regulator with XRE-family HTH domain
MDQSVSIGGRLQSERKRLGLNQSAIGMVGKVTKKTQMLYESGERSPDAQYLSAIAQAGVDVLYVLTGRVGALSAEEETLVSYFRAATKDVQRAVLGALLGAKTGISQSAHGINMSNSADGGVQVGVTGGDVNVEKRPK